ncbi:MAG: hypothetical protein R3F60_06415 [bacterium]
MTRCLLVFCLGAALTACDDGTDPDDPGDAGAGADAAPMTGFPLAGRWVDEFGTEHEISEEVWVQTAGGMASTFELLDIDTEAGRILAANDPANPFNPGLFSRFDWVVDGEDLFFCQAAFDAASVEAAAAAAPSDASDPATSGCGGMFPWTRLLPGG